VKVGDLIVYRNPNPKRQHLELPAIVVAARVSTNIESKKSFRIYYPFYNEWLNCWAEEFEVISDGRKIS